MWEYAAIEGEEYVVFFFCPFSWEWRLEMVDEEDAERHHVGLVYVQNLTARRQGQMGRG